MNSREIESLAVRLAQAVDMPGLHRRPPESHVDWEEWMALVDEHQVGPLLGSRRTWERSGPLPTWVKDMLLAQSVRNTHEMVFQVSELLRLFRARPKVAAVLLKGGALALTRYEHSGERVISDFDVLFRGVGSLEEIKQVLLEQGYQEKPSVARETPHHHHPPLHHPGRSVTFELHENLCTPPLPRPIIQEMIDLALPLGDGPWPAGLRIFDPVTQIIHQAFHALDDPIESPLLRNLLEVGWQLHTLDRFERERVEDLASRWGLAERVAEAAHLAHELFGTPPLFAAPEFGARRAWASMRLTWTGSRRRERPWSRRFSSHLAGAHLGLINDGEDPTDLLVFAKVLGESMRSSARSFLLGRRRDRALERSKDLETVSIGDALLVFDRPTGAVHLLDPLTAEMLLLADSKKSAKEITREMTNLGIRDDVVRSGLRLLLERGLLGALSVGGLLPLCY